MATRKKPTAKPPSLAEAAAIETSDGHAGAGEASLSAEDGHGSEGRQPRFHFFIIDSGWKTDAAKVLRENFHMLREFQENDPLYVLSRDQSIALIRKNPDLIGRDPIVLVHDLHAQGGRGESGYHGFRLCLGVLHDGQQALAAMQKFLRFVKRHRQSTDIEKDIRDKLHRKGLEGTIEVIREGAELMLG